LSTAKAIKRSKTELFWMVLWKDMTDRNHENSVRITEKNQDRY